MGHPLKLRAEDPGDLAVIAACLQDAIAPVAEMGFQASENAFFLLVSRFCWEDEPEVASPSGPTADEEDEPPLYSRVPCAVRITGVQRVQTRGLDLRQRGQILSLLTLTADPESLTLVFAGNAAIRLEGPSWRLWLEDMGETWPTRRRPSHPETFPDPDGKADPATGTPP